MIHWDLNRNEGVEILGLFAQAQTRIARNVYPNRPLHTARLCSGPTNLQGRLRYHLDNTFRHDPELRIILFRAMALTMREKPEPLMPLVFTESQTQTVRWEPLTTWRNWKGKLRGTSQKLSHHSVDNRYPAGRDRVTDDLWDR